MDASLNAKANLSYVDPSLNAKASLIYVDASLNAKANLLSPYFSGTPQAPTAANTTNTFQIATTAFVHSLLPAGTIIQYAANGVPSGWLFCNGQSLSTSTYVLLFTAIGYTYGGSGSTFNIPDMQGRVGIGDGTGTGLTTRNLGVSGGEETHTLAVNEMPSHDHGGVTGTSNALSGTRLVTGNSSGVSVYSANGSINQLTHNHTIASQGDNAPHNNMQPYVVLRYLIKY